MRGACQSDPEFLTVFTEMNARRVSVGTKFPGDIPRVKCDSLFGQNRNSRHRFSFGTNIPGDFFQFGREAFFGLNGNSWRYLPIWMRGVFRREPKFLATFSSLDARSYSARTKIPSNIYQFERDAFFGQNRNSCL